MLLKTMLPVESIVRPQLGSPGAGRYDDAIDLFSRISRSPELVGGFPSFAPHLLGGDHTGYSEIEIAAMEKDQASGFYWPARNEMIAWLLHRYFSQARRVLDIGCGTGYVTERAMRVLPGACFYATDTSIDGLRVANRKLEGRAFLTHVDASNLPFRQAFDLITTFDVLEHIEDDRAVIRETFEALRPGGGVLHFVPQHPGLYSPADRESRHFRRYGRGELQSKLVDAGFSIAYSSSFICALFPLFVVSRVKSMLTGRHSHVEEHGQAAWISGLLSSVQGLEFSLLKRGWRYPVGVSRAVVAFRPK